LLAAWLADRIQELEQDEKVTKDTIKTVASKMGMKVT
jgi:DNA-binding HxlR family transcriptional regulator